jgi:hypothetical protein
MTTATMKTSEPGTVDIAKRTVCIKLDFHSFGNSKKINGSNIEVKDDAEKIDTKVNKKRIRASKRLLESKELAHINSHFMMIKNYVWSVCVPFEKGIHLVPIPMVPKVEAQLKAFQKDLPPLISAFIKAAKDLNSQYRAQDYPSVAELKQQFSFGWRYISFGVPDKLKSISAAMWEEEREKASQRMKEAAVEIQQVMREAMLQLVKHMADRLKEDKEGKPLTFHKSTVSKLTEFLGSFEFRNVTDDKELQGIVAKAKALLDGVDVEKIRDVGTVRLKMTKDINILAAQLGKLTTRGTRKFRLED